MFVPPLLPPPLRLPTNQDCHEMWSRRKRKKERQSVSSRSVERERQPVERQPSQPPPAQNPPSSHPTSPQPPPTTKTTSSPPPQPEPSLPPGSDPLANCTARPGLSVPLPSQPLQPLPAGILDSLHASDVAPPPHNEATHQLQKVIIDAQRKQLALLSQLSQQLSGQQQPRQPVPGGKMQTFDYGNHSNKDLELVASEKRWQ